MTVSPRPDLPDDQGRMLPSASGRERAIDVLTAAFASGRLTRQEHDVRAGGAQSARTYGELAALTADLPGGQWFAQQPPWQPQRWQPVSPPSQQPAGDRSTQVAWAVWLAVVLTSVVLVFLLMDVAQNSGRIGP